MPSPTAATNMMLGLACGDLLGRSVKYQSADAIANQHGAVAEMLGHGTHGQPVRTVTDDTDLALCIARSLVDSETFDGQDVAERLHKWSEAGPA